MQFDSFYESVGAFGRYQKIKYFLVCLTFMTPPILVYTWTFTAATPSFDCRLSSTDDHRSHRSTPTASQCRIYENQLSVLECQRCFLSTNTSHEHGEPLQACTDFVFHRTYYQSTLVEEWSMVCNRLSYKSLAQTIFFFGYMIGSLVFGVLSDRFGRRPTMGVGFVVMSVGSLICALAPQKQWPFEISYTIFVFGRFLLACATRGIAMTGFVIGLEIVGPEQRIVAGIVIEYFFGIGELILLALAYVFRAWHSLHIALAILTIPFLAFYFVIPESPRWLLAKGYYDEAEKLFRQIAKINKKSFDVIGYERLVEEEKKRESLHEKTNHSGLTLIFRSKVMCIIAMNMSFQWFAQNAIFFGVSQNTSTWLFDPYIAFGASALVEIGAYFVIHLVMHRWGRKNIYCSFVMGFSIFAFLVIPIQMFMTNDSRSQVALMFIVNTALKFFTSGSYAVICIYTNELFPTQVRNTGIGICSMVAQLGAIVGTLFYDFLIRAWLYFPIVVFGVVSVISVGFALIFPETLGRPLPETIDDIERVGLAFSLTKAKQSRRAQIDTSDGVDVHICLKEQTKHDEI